MSDSLYERDFFQWTAEQARALRAAGGLRINAPLDWENLAEEIESLGRSQKSELASRILVIVEHLMKLQASPARDPRRGWRATIRRERALIRRLLSDSPSLRRAVPDMIAEAMADARGIVEEELAGHGEPTDRVAALDYTEAQVLGDWLPE